MAITAAELRVVVSAMGIETTTAQLNGLAGMLKANGAVAMAGAVAVGAVVAVGVVATKMAADFQSGMTTLVTGAGEAQSNIGMVSQGILKMARDTGTSTQQLTSGMFMIESAGYHGAAGLNILQVAAEGAKVGNADLGTTADALTTVLKDYPNVTGGATGAMNTLVQTVANGKTHMEDLASSLSAVLPTASAAGIGLNDVMGAMATMTGEGVQAANASTYLRQTILALNAPTKQARDAMAAVGLNSTQVALDMKKSLPMALQEIQDHLAATYGQGTPAYVAGLKDIVGGSKEIQGALDLTGNHMQDFYANTAKITKGVKDGGNAVTGWSDVQKTFNLQFDRAKEVVQTLMIELGEKLLPVATQLMSFIANNAIPAITNLVSWISGTSESAKVMRPILAALAIMIGGALAASFAIWAAGAIAAGVATLIAAGPILLIGAGIALLIAGIVLLVTHWKQITAAFADSSFGKGVLGVFNDIKTAVSWLLTNLANLGKAIGGALGSAGKALGGLHIPGFAAGTMSAPGGLAVVGESGPELVNLPAGSQVIPLAGGLPSGGGAASAAGGPMVINLQVDGRTLAQIVTKYQPSVIRQATGSRGF